MTSAQLMRIRLLTKVHASMNAPGEVWVSNKHESMKQDRVDHAQSGANTSLQSRLCFDVSDRKL